MRNALRISMVAMAAATLFAGAATADVTVLGFVGKVKSIAVTETTDITKSVAVGVVVGANPVGASESQLVKNQRNEINTVADATLTSATSIDGSGVAANGLLLINQATGSMNNQGNEVSLTFAEGLGTTPDQLAHAQTEAAQIDQTNNKIELQGATASDSLTGSFAGSGVVGVNQAANSLNNQSNSMSVSIADSAIVALSEADLGQLNTGNTQTAVAVVRADSIASSFNGFAGVGTVNQSAGAMNNQSNVTSVATSTGLNFLSGL